MKRLFSGILSALLTLGGLNIPAYAAEKIDYSSKIAEIQSLIDECNDNNIATDYEQVNLSVLKKFNSYINSDIDNGFSDEIVDYNISCMEELYKEAKENLSAYINGSRTPYNIARADMLNLSYDAKGLKDKNGAPVWSVGYGHSTCAADDIGDFQKFGADNIQTEIYPRAYFTKQLSGWDFTKSYADGDFEMSKDVFKSGAASLKLVNNTAKEGGKYIALTQKIPCEKYKTYKIGCSVKGASASDVFIAANGIGGTRNYFSVSEEWTDISFDYKTSTSQTEIEIVFVAEDTAEIYIDDFYVRKINSEENILSNGGFEDEYDYSKNLTALKNTLKNAENNNVCVSLLLSPHVIDEGLDGIEYTQADYLFIKYNVDTPKAREMIEKYLRGVLPELQGYSAINNICLTNEPVYNTWLYPGSYNPKFREYLKEKYNNSLPALNSACGTSFSSWDSISLSTVTANSGMAYERIAFNDKTFADWHNWMADIVTEYFPNTPLHSKVMNYFGISESENMLLRGTDMNLFAEFIDYAGCDSEDYLDEPQKYYEEMFFYDYLRTVIKKPVYNSEDHIIKDYSENYTINQRKHWVNNLWMGAVHGRSMSTIWNWERSMKNSPLFRPDIIAETGHTKLDLTRLKKEVSALANKKSKVALMYSKSARIYDSGYQDTLYNAYKALIELGIHPAIVSDEYMDSLSDYDYLILPEVTNAETSAKTKVEEFIANGGTLIYSGSPMSKNEHNRTLDNSKIISAGIKYSGNTKSAVKTEFSKLLKDYLTVTIIDESTGDIPEDVDWCWEYSDGKLILNITNLKYDDVKYIGIYENGEPISGIKNLITDDVFRKTIKLDGYTPVILRCGEDTSYPVNYITDVSVSKSENKIKWKNLQQENSGSEIYSVNSDGSVSLLSSGNSDFFAYSGSNTYMINPINYSGKSNGKCVTVSDGKVFETSADFINYSGGSLDCGITVKNKQKTFSAGEFILTAIKESGEECAVASCRITLRGNGKTNWKVSADIGRDVSAVKLYSTDGGIDGNELASTIYKNIAQ